MISPQVFSFKLGAMVIAITATEVVDGNTDIAFQNRGGGVRSEKLRITSAGNVGITFQWFQMVIQLFLLLRLVVDK